MNDYLEVSGLGRKLQDWPVFEAWRQALGEPLAERARPVAFVHGELSVEVESSAHLHEFKNFTGERYRCLANRRLGREAIRQVAFKLKR